jgi:hypothetical protein
MRSFEAEPVGRFTDLPDAPRVKAADRPIYKLSVRAEPGVDGIRALRWLLKSMLRRHGLRCVDIRREPPGGS